MWLNCIYGGKGVGMINLLLYLIVGVFIAGLMVGRTPEYLGKKVASRKMKLAMIALLVHPNLVEIAQQRRNKGDSRVYWTTQETYQNSLSVSQATTSYITQYMRLSPLSHMFFFSCQIPSTSYKSSKRL
jgi:uncharacterized membrane-anchored protein YitT (DUF2179 family)